MEPGAPQACGYRTLKIKMPAACVSNFREYSTYFRRHFRERELSYRPSLS